ncbi:MAG: hypothetical protein HY791_25645, partial [Deltaproteobacteria bacterium]|nr:hypothetical protein [Deltaproteobacteria bacterium]
SQVRRVRMSCCLVSQTPVRDSLDGDRCRDPHGLMASLLERYAPRIAGANFGRKRLSYLRLSELHVGLLINFHVAKLRDGIKRL